MDKRERLPSMYLGSVDKLFHDHVRRECDSLGIPQGFRHLMFHLSRHDGLSQLELANLANLRPPTISVTLQKMEAAGLVSREVNPNDQRQIRVTLTERGRELDDKIRDTFAKTEALFIKGLSNYEIDELKRLLTKVENNLKGSLE